MKIELNALPNTDNYIVSILGFKVGFDKTEWFEECLMLKFNDNIVASIEGEMLHEFKRVAALYEDMNLLWEFDLED